jgi:hypothetical protein
LIRSIKKYGRENFSIEIIEFLPDRESLKKREAELITEDLLQDQMCMNLVLGGAGGTHNESTGRRISEKLTGRKLSTEHRQNISVGVTAIGDKLAHWRGKQLSEEHKKRIGNKVRGHVMSQEARDKISRGNLGKKRTIEQNIANTDRNSKEYLLISEDGQEQIIKNLMRWCKEHHINNPRLRLFSSKDVFYRGFKVLKPDRSLLVVTRQRLKK